MSFSPQSVVSYLAWGRGGIHYMCIITRCYLQRLDWGSILCCPVLGRRWLGHTHTHRGGHTLESGRSSRRAERTAIAKERARDRESRPCLYNEGDL